MRDPVGSRILLVEDNPGDVLLTCDALADAGFALPQTASSLEQAIAILDAGAVDLVLLDLGLPDADGIEALQRILATLDIPVIVLTGADSEIGVAAVKAGAQDYLRKGTFDADRLGMSVALAQERHDRRSLMSTRADAVIRAHERLSRFVGVVAHDLRSPLVNAEQWARLARNGTAPNLDEALDRVIRNLGNQFKLIDNLLAIYRDHELEKVDVELADLVAELTDDLALNDVVSVMGELPRVCGAKESLVSVLSNMLRNAAAHASVDDVDLVIQVSARRLDDQILVRLDDNGPGIAPDRRTAIFDRGHSSTVLHQVQQGEDVASGFGLGLSGSRDAIEAMGGLLWVEDGLLGGAGFVLALPAAGGRARGGG